MKRNQPGLRDIGRIFVDVRVGDVTLKVRGLTSRDILELMNRFDPVRKLLEGGREEVAKKIGAPNAPQSLLATLPEAVFSAMATCTGATRATREEDERIASELAFGDQVTIINAIFQATFRDGVGPFMKTLNQLSAVMRQMQTPELEVVATSASRSALPSRSLAALHVDLPPEKLGRLHLAS